MTRPKGVRRQPSQTQPVNPPQTLEAIALETETLIEPLADREVEVFDRIRGELGQGTPETEFTVKVFRRIAGPNRTNTNEFLFNASVDELPTLLVRVRDEYGAGRFRFCILKGGRPFAEYHQDVALPKAANPTLARPGMPSGNAGLEGFFASMLERQERMFEAMMQRLSSAPIAAPAAPSAGMSTKEVIESFVMLQGLIPKAAPAEPKIVEIFEKGVDLAMKLNGAAGGGGEGEGGMVGLLREAIRSPLLQGAVAQALTPPGAAPQPGAHPPIIGGPAMPLPPPGARPQAAPIAGNGAGAMQAGLGQGVAYLVSKAAEGANPALFVDWLSDNVPDAVWGELERQDDPVAFLISQFPTMAPHKAWFGRLLELCYEPGSEAGADNDVPDMQPNPA